jgi:protein prenyltransferase alpha subunit repeat containing protein 1
LQFLNVIFTSPLPRHTKSPILWSHRRFLTELLAKQQSLPSLQDEMTVIFTAADRHPKNYHAWTYARFIWVCTWQYSETQWQLPQLNGRVKSWCTSNVSDHSGWMFYLWYWGVNRPWKEEMRELEKPVDVVLKVVRMGKDVTPGHEALWAFVRSCIIGMEGVLEERDREAVISVILEYVRELEESTKLRDVEERNLIALRRLSLMTDKAKLMSAIESMGSGDRINENLWTLLLRRERVD